MTIARVITVLMIFIAGFSVSAQAQRTRRPAPRPTPTPAKSLASADEKAAKQTASNQMANVSGYLKKFTPLVEPANGLARDEKAGKLSSRAKNDFANFKRGLSITLSDFKVGLTNLENDFKTKPKLAKYLIKIQGITDLAVTAQNAAGAGQYDGVREALKGIVQRLTDTVAAMP